MRPQLTLISHHPTETQAVGKALGRYAQPGDVYLLSGALGTGKTCLTQGIAWGMGITEYAHSPTFVLVHQYTGLLTMYHIDLFRLDNPLQVIDIGIDEYLNGNGVCVVEWAEKAPSVFPSSHLLITMKHTGYQDRHLTIAAYGARYQELIESLRMDLV